jgi:hypothetical protein
MGAAGPSDYAEKQRKSVEARRRNGKKQKSPKTQPAIGLTDEEAALIEASELGDVVGPDKQISLTHRHRSIIRDIITGTDTRTVARANGVSENYIRNLVKGRQTSKVRAVLQVLLEQEGLDLFTMAQRAAELMDAKDFRWNPKTEQWDEFEDNKTRLGAWRHLTVLHQAVGSMRGEDGKEDEPRVSINVNFGTDTAKEVDGVRVNGGHFEIDVTPLGEAEAEDGAFREQVEPDFGPEEDDHAG